MSRFLEERYQKLTPYTPGEQPKVKDLIKLNTNESPYPPGPKTLAAVTDPDLAAGLRRYNDPEAGRLRDLLAARYGVSRENVYVSNGSDDILNFSFQAFGGDGVLFPAISYGFYQVFADLHQRDYVKVPLRADLTIDPRDYMDKGRLVVLANPNAPTGRTLSLPEIEEILRHNEDHVVLIDEAYVDFGGASSVPLTKEYPNLLVTMTFSKSRSLAGARLGFAIGDRGLIQDLERLKYATNPYNVNSLTQAAGAAALAEEDYYQANCRRIMKTRERTAAALKEMGFQVVPSQANFLFVRTDRMAGGDLYQALRDRKILVRHFDQEEIRDYNRITIGTDQEMDALIQAVGEILAGKEA